MWALLAAFAYLALVNLDWALFWDDEATMAYLARNWLELGAPLVDDGRNVYTFGGKAGRDIAADGTFAYPPLTTALYALAFKFSAMAKRRRARSARFFPSPRWRCSRKFCARNFRAAHGFARLRSLSRASRR